MTVRPCPIPRCTTVDDLGNPLPVSTPLCDPCHGRVDRALLGIAEIYVQLNQALAAPRSSGLAEQITASRELKVPVSVTTRAMQEMLVALMRDTERHYRIVRGLSGATNLGREGVALQTRAEFLHRQLDPLLDLPFGVEFAITLLTLTHQARRTLGLTRYVQRLTEPCPACDAKGLERTAGASEIGCRACGLRFGEDEYDRLLIIRGGDVAA